MTTIWTEIYKKYKGQWVAVKSQKDPKVIASGKTLNEVVKKADKEGVKAPYVAQIPQEILPIVGSL